MTIPNPVPNPQNSDRGDGGSNEYGSVFLILGLVFTILGFSTPAFFVMGIAFFIIGIANGGWDSLSLMKKRKPTSENHNPEHG